MLVYDFMVAIKCKNQQYYSIYAKDRMDFEQLPHTADIKIRVYGATLSGLFRNAVVGMFQAIHPVVPGCSIKNDRVVCPVLPQKHHIIVESIDLEALLVDFLSHVLYLSDVHNEAYLDAHIHAIDQTHIDATVYGAKITGFEVVEIKAVTYHDLKIEEINGSWQAEIVFDI